LNESYDLHFLCGNISIGRAISDDQITRTKWSDVDKNVDCYNHIADQIHLELSAAITYLQMVIYNEHILRSMIYIFNN